MQENTKQLIAAAAAGAAAVAAATAMMRRGARAGAILESGKPPVAIVPFTNAELSNVACPMPGTMVFCVQNLAISGANQVSLQPPRSHRELAPAPQRVPLSVYRSQVLLNLAEGCVWNGNIVLISPSTGPFGKEFAALGVGVHIGELEDVLYQIRDVRVAICNTIMTAHNVCTLHERGIPQLWVGAARVVARPDARRRAREAER